MRLREVTSDEEALQYDSEYLDNMTADLNTLIISYRAKGYKNVELSDLVEEMNNLGYSVSEESLKIFVEDSRVIDEIDEDGIVHFIEPGEEQE